eukprot:2619868-Rhodomonas_salina.1
MSNTPGSRVPGYCHFRFWIFLTPRFVGIPGYLGTGLPLIIPGGSVGIPSSCQATYRAAPVGIPRKSPF